MKKSFMLSFCLGLCLLTSCALDLGYEDYEVNIAPALEQEAGVRKADAFVLDGISICLKDEFLPISKFLGEPLDYFEAPSCAFEGMDKIFYYSGLEFRTYPEGDSDLLSEILLKDDTVTTAEGCFIGMTLDEMLLKQGHDYVKEGSQYSYPVEEGSLIFVENSDVIVAINYSTGLELAT